jgi:hypothetical protein
MEPGRVENIGANHKTCRRDTIQCGTIERSGTMGLWKQSRGKAIRPSKQALPTAANTTPRSLTEKTRKDLIFSEKSRSGWQALQAQGRVSAVGFRPLGVWFI